MKRLVTAFLLIFLVGAFAPVSLHGNEFKEREAKIAQYKKWLDTLGPKGSRYWIRLDARHPNGASHHQKVVVIDDRVDVWRTCKNVVKIHPCTCACRTV